MAGTAAETRSGQGILFLMTPRQREIYQALGVAPPVQVYHLFCATLAGMVGVAVGLGNSPMGGLAGMADSCQAHHRRLDPLGQIINRI
ncbi:hypothetical protein AU468_13565 [Alkalispirochaeta sphaeroplastigenens]|uniref:Uncharacterized protein n=2 Tax=Alkalispirochaeta sphaeroplastigenens TaxID=1187066 RepID=A0A2S4JFN6_9SPIO|nr:hypothetical protein AU468_13565 [Alkalispirochaeta sphaeroplastigenens]